MTTTYADFTARSASRHVRNWPWRNVRRIKGAVLVDGRIVDSFESSDAATLRAIVRPIARHMPSFDAKLKLVGVEMTSLPFGLAGESRVAMLPNLEAATTFLGC